MCYRRRHRLQPSAPMALVPCPFPIPPRWPAAMSHRPTLAIDRGSAHSRPRPHADHMGNQPGCHCYRPGDPPPSLERLGGGLSAVVGPIPPPSHHLRDRFSRCHPHPCPVCRKPCPWFPLNSRGCRWLRRAPPDPPPRSPGRAPQLRTLAPLPFSSCAVLPFFIFIIIFPIR